MSFSLCDDLSAPVRGVPSVAGSRILRPGCKINLYLRILGTHPDGPRKGWHELDTLFLPLSEPHDELVLSPGASGAGLRVRCDAPEVDPERNTLTRAYELYAAAACFRPDLDARLVKGIPSGAGLGGGSSDAAALLAWLEAHSPTPLGSARLAEVAASTGADVPFFLINRPCRARGIGEELSPCAVSGLAGRGLALICPPIRVSTPEAYAAWDRQLPGKKSDCAAEPLTSADLKATDSASRSLRERAAVCWLENSFEEVVFALYPRLARIKKDLLRCGAQAAVMSGSGAALFGIFRNPEEAVRAVRMFREKGMAAYGHALPGFLPEGR